MTTVPVNGPMIALHQFPQCFAQVDEARHENFTANALQHIIKSDTYTCTNKALADYRSADNRRLTIG